MRMNSISDDSVIDGLIRWDFRRSQQPDQAGITMMELINIFEIHHKKSHRFSLIFEQMTKIKIQHILSRHSFVMMRNQSRIHTKYELI